MENEEVDRGQNSMSFKEKDLFNKRQREQWTLSKDYRNKRRRELRLKKSDNQHTDNYTRYRQQLNSGRSEGIICNHSEVGNLLDTDTSDVLDNIETNIVHTGHSTMPVRDVGNNNYLSKSLARASLPWYGIDFGSGMPNGRFSNGRTVTDIIGDNMGLPRPSAFLDPSLTEDVILENGVNYALGGGGILNETGGYFIQRFCLYKQIELFQETQYLIKSKICNKEADKFFQEAQYVVALGSNDFINNYLMPVYSDSWIYPDDSFVQYLMQTLREQLSDLAIRILRAVHLEDLTRSNVYPSINLLQRHKQICILGLVQPILVLIN
ncbi:GDSL esterase/lipase [Forsythia ovata]|uniref:GDSL esterase/lipase n=1 Tax=Forsythia ovata TaxID=205694 RepID=A0ABD1NZ08_9LAMI